MHDGAAGGWLWERKRCRKSVLHAYEGDFFASASVDTLCSTPAREQSTARHGDGRATARQPTGDGVRLEGGGRGAEHGTGERVPAERVIVSYTVSELAG